MNFKQFVMSWDRVVYSQCFYWSHGKERCTFKRGTPTFFSHPRHKGKHFTYEDLHLVAITMYAKLELL